MIAIPVDENLCIIQPYYDGSESYTNHHKYSLLKNYRCTPECAVKRYWSGICVEINANSETILETVNITEINIEEYKRFVLSCMTPKGIKIKLYCNDELVLDKVSEGMSGKMYGDEIDFKTVKSLKYVFVNDENKSATATLFYLGLVGKEKAKRNPYTSEWEGFFAENPDYSLYDEAIMNQSDLEALRSKIKSDEAFAEMYNEIKKSCMVMMGKEPEELIGRDISKIKGNMIDLALVGQIEQDKEILKMACRYALSAATCEFWTDDAEKEKTPMTTWCGRAFNESNFSSGVASVISLAGGLLSWHGRHYLYDKIIMKGLPRIEADLLTVDYIYHMNQGIVFLSGYAAALNVLVREYPRYSIRLEEAEAKLDEMLKQSFEKDGSSTEGATYWLFTVMKYMTAAYSIARYKKMSLKEFVGNKLDVIAEYGISVLDENCELIPFNDSHWHQGVGQLVPWMFYSITGDERWAKVYNSVKGGIPAAHFIVMFMSGEDVIKTNINIVNPFYYAPVSGYTQVYRDGIHFIATGGPSNSTHAHEDKGSFIIYKNGEMVAPDCCDNSNIGDAADLYMSKFHSITTPEIAGKTVNQLRGDGKVAPIEKAEYSNGNFLWSCDLSTIWDCDRIKKNIRTISSDKADEFVICDEFEFTEPTSVNFRLNVRYEDAIQIETVNWKAVAENVEIIYEHGDQKSYQVSLQSGAGEKLKLITKIMVK